MAESPDERSVNFSAICPYLHSREDPATAYAYPAVANRCYCPRGPKSLGVEHQATFCLGTGHKQCPFYLAQQEAWSRHINRPRGSAHDIFQDWHDHLGRALGDIEFVLREQLPGARRGLELTRTYVGGLGVTNLMVAAAAILVLLGGAAYVLDAGNKGTLLTEASSAGSILTPTATVLQIARPQAGFELSPSETPLATPTEEPTSTPLATSTEEPTSTPLSKATFTPLPTASLTPTRRAVLVKKSTATFTPTTEATPSVTLVYAAPVLLDPPDGMGLQKNTILRWSSDHELNPNEVFDVLVWPESLAQPASIGNTTEKIFALDFRSWIYPQHSGTFFWTIRIKVVDGEYLSPANPPFSFTVNESGPVVPPAPPPPTSAPPVPQPTKPPPPKPSPPPP